MAGAPRDGMTGGLPPGADDEPFRACPFCTLRVPAASTVCPHCAGILPPRESEVSMRARLRSFEGRFDVLRDLYRRQSVLVKASAPVLLGLIVVVLFFLVTGPRVRVTVVPNPALVVTFEKEKRGDDYVVRGAVRNEGEDVPDLSLRSIRLTAEFAYKDGHVLRKAVFPKAEFRGEGALLNGESGAFSLEAPASGLRTVRLEATVVDLGGTRILIPPGTPSPRKPANPPSRKRR